MTLAEFEEEMVDYLSSRSPGNVEYRVTSHWLERLRVWRMRSSEGQVIASHIVEHPALYDLARDICFDLGYSWTDPRTGETFQPPKVRV